VLEADHSRTLVISPDAGPVHGELIDLEHFVDFARRVANSESFTKDMRTNSDGGHSAGPESGGAHSTPV
jgi:hypothetical protein